jgi:Bacterial Ig-like domain/Fibronectin type III domain
MADIRSSNNKMIAGRRTPIRALVIGMFFIVCALSSGLTLPASAVTVTTMMDGTNKIIYDHNGTKMPTGEAIQIIYASGQAIHAPGSTGEATGGDSLIWTGHVGQGELGDPPYIMGNGAFIKEFAGGQSLIDDSNVYIRVWNSPSIETATYYGNSQLSPTLDAGIPPMPISWSVPTFYASTEFTSVATPSDPSPATLEALSDTSMRLIWQDNSNNEQGFRVEMSTSETWTSIITATVDANVTSYEADGLATNEAYWFRVRAYNGINNSGYATAESIYTMANAPIDPLVLGVNGASYDCVISWESGGTQTAYAVYRGSPEAQGGALIYTGTATTTIDANLVFGQPHFYYIYASNVDNALTTFISSADSSVMPGTPEGLATTNITATTAYGTWEISSYAGLYQISYGTYATATGEALVTTDEAAYTFTGLSSTTEYYWKVAAVNVNGTSEYSTIASFTTTAMPLTTIPGTPEGLQVTSVSTDFAHGIWSAVFGADHYTVSFGTDEAATNIGAFTTDEASYYMTGLTATTEYYWKVSASDVYGTSEYSATVSFETLLTPESIPADPGPATAEALSDTSMSFAWQVNSGDADGFIIEVSSTEPWSTIYSTVDANASDDMFTTYGLSTNEAYWFRVKAYNLAGSSGYATTEGRYTMANTPIAPLVMGVNGTTYDCYITWETGGTQAAYAVYRDQPAILGGTLIYTGTAATTTDANLVFGQPHFYYIYAYNNDNVLTATYVSSADSNALPGTPEGLTATNISAITAYGTWEISSYAGSYIVSYGTQESAADTVDTTDEAAYTFTGLTATTEYFWKVAAVNVNGSSEYSSVASFTTEAVGGLAPNVPTGLGQYMSDGITVISTGEWLLTPTIEVKMVMSASAPGPLYPEVEIEPVGTDFTDTATIIGSPFAYSTSPVTGIITIEDMPEGAYHWQACVSDSIGNTSNWVSFGGNDESAMDFGVDMTPPVNTFTLMKPDLDSWVNTQTPTFEWTPSSDDVSGLARYELWIDRVKNEDVPSLETSATPASPLSQGLHTWEVIAVDYAGNTSVSANTWEVNVNTGTLEVSSTTPESNATGVFLFPNITATFNNNLTGTTVTSSNFEMTGTKTGAHTTNPSYNDSTRTVTFNQTGIFVTNETVTCTVDTGVLDKSGNSMSGAYTWTFMTTTENPPATAMTLTAYLQGYYDPTTGAQRPATVEVEIRSGSDPGSATSVVTSEEIALDATGMGTADINAMGPYYVVIKHRAGSTIGPNHLAIITSGEVTFGGGTVTVNVSDPSSGNFFGAYTPVLKASMPAMYTEPANNKLVMRGGNANGDNVVNASIDFPTWASANGSDPLQANWDINADFDGNGFVTSAGDFPIWLTNNGYQSYVP